MLWDHVEATRNVIEHKSDAMRAVESYARVIKYRCIYRSLGLRCSQASNIEYWGFQRFIIACHLKLVLTQLWAVLIDWVATPLLLGLFLLLLVMFPLLLDLLTAYSFLERRGELRGE